MIVAVFVYPMLAIMGAGFGALAIDHLFPDFLTDDYAENRWRMAGIFAVALSAICWFGYRVDGMRFYRLYSDRLVIGRSGMVSIPLVQILRMRVGAPMPSLVRGVRRVNATLGKLLPGYAVPADVLDAQYAGTVVLDLSDRERYVINLSTVAHGGELLDALAQRLAAKIESPPSYAPEELAAFGRFVPGRYVI
jgi:hypothetical protein